VQVIGHQQAKAAMPDELVVVVRHGREDATATIRLAELIRSLRQTFDGDEKPTSLGNPLRDGVRQFFPNG